MRKYGRIIALVMVCIFVLSACGLNVGKLREDDKNGSGNGGDENVAEGDGLLSISKTDAGDLVIKITDDSFRDRIKPDDHITDYRALEDALYWFTFYNCELIGTDIDAARQPEWMTSFANLEIYSCGCHLESYETTDSGSGYTGKWEFDADWLAGGFTLDGNTLTMSFKGAGPYFSGNISYVCDALNTDYQFENGNGLVAVNEAGKGSMTAPIKNPVAVHFLDDDTVYVTVYDENLKADANASEYQVLFCKDKHLDSSGKPYPEYILISRLNDGGTYYVCTFEHDYEPLDYYEKYNASTDDAITSYGQAMNWYGDAEVYDGYLNMSFSYEKIKDILSDYEYVAVVTGWGEDEELISLNKFGEVASLEDYTPYPKSTIEALREEYVRPYDESIFEPKTPYYTVLSSEIYGPVANGMAWRQIKTCSGTPFYPEPPFPNAWGYLPEVDTERNGHAISTLLESYDEFGNLVQSVLRIEYDSVEDLERSYIPWNKIYYPYAEYGVDEPSVEYVNPEYFEISREEMMRETALDAVCLGVYDNYIYYDVMGIYWNLQRYRSCFSRWYVTAELENYYREGSDYSSRTYTEVVPPPFVSAVELRGNIDSNVENGEWYNNSDEIRVDLIRNGSLHYVPDVGENGQGVAFVHDNTSKVDSIGGYMGEITGDTPTGLMQGYSHVSEIKRVLNFVD